MEDMCIAKAIGFVQGRGITTMWKGIGKAEGAVGCGFPDIGDNFAKNQTMPDDICGS
jgi:hypothetical protein